MIYGFVEARKANHSVSAMCRTLKVSKSGYYGWRGRPPCQRIKADAVLSEHIERIHQRSRGTYGAPRIHFELRTLGIRCARKRVARLMRGSGLFGCGARRRARTTTRKGDAAEERAGKVPDLVKRNFDPEAPDRLWVADITYVRTREGWGSTSRFRVGRLLPKGGGLVDGQNHLRAELVLDALNMASTTAVPLQV